MHPRLKYCVLSLMKTISMAANPETKKIVQISRRESYMDPPIHTSVTLPRLNGTMSVFGGARSDIFESLSLVHHLRHLHLPP